MIATVLSHQFQQLDMTSLQGATIGSFGIDQGFMCNGANCIHKILFTANGLDEMTDC
jgi:hypothetical protein